MHPLELFFYFLHLGSYIMSTFRWVQWSVHSCNPKEQCRNSIKDYIYIVTLKNLDLAIPESSPIWTFHLSQCESFSPYSLESWLSALNLEIWRHSHFSDTQLVIPWTRKFKVMAQSNFLNISVTAPNLALKTASLLGVMNLILLLTIYYALGTSYSSLHLWHKKQRPFLILILGTRIMWQLYVFYRRPSFDILFSYIMGYTVIRFHFIAIFKYDQSRGNLEWKL